MGFSQLYAMRKIYLLVLLSLVYTKGSAQWSTKVGVNLLPLTVRSLEITSEFNKDPHFALTVNAGYVHNTSYEGILGSKVGDGVSSRSTSGSFYKVGGRYYFMGSRARQPKVNIFAGALFIGSHYSKIAYIEDYIAQTRPVKSSKSGFSWGPAVTAGLTFHVNNRLSVDTGIQYSFVKDSKQNIGRKDFNYEPGFGASKSLLLLPAFPPLAIIATNAQAIVVLKYKL